MNTSQLLFSIALGAVTLVVVGFAIYVVSTTLWGDKWVRRSK
ncbi:hypothetical protein SAMN02745225_00784 [Ferrithrix thermotolerans DSM 19514]|uniref:Uncharacterized protein n=1 Tax=Ferrithrix thermotolerans DSM 19514 TaxID=1121881 RepID=A0A1M4TYP2_9ACTN|nr:hypothetical protein [Ferrithrix thermotolerans]SHE49632.1 hypothetical protein SAMN02745225_00784 [Ferrithrix thermotolerans DSM 19514]